MDKEIKAKWVEALRSGRYQQGLGRLRRDDCHCCLGVLADLIAPEQWIALGKGKFEHDNCTAFPSHDILRSAGIVERTAIDLGERNDTGATFSELADYIEANL